MGLLDGVTRAALAALTSTIGVDNARVRRLIQDVMKQATCRNRAARAEDPWTRLIAWAYRGAQAGVLDHLADLVS